MALLDKKCPACDVLGQARPLGDFSLAGVQMKVSATEVPRLTCGACGLDLTGRIEDGNAVFTPPPDLAAKLTGQAGTDTDYQGSDVTDG